MLSRATPRRRRRAEAGSALILMPTGLLIVVVLGSLAVDRAVVFGAQRELVALAQAAANDGAAAVDQSSLRDGAGPTFEPQAVDQAVRRAVGLPGVAVHWTARDGTIVVRLERSVELVFAPALATQQRQVVVGPGVGAARGRRARTIVRAVVIFHVV